MTKKSFHVPVQTWGDGMGYSVAQHTVWEFHADPCIIDIAVFPHWEVVVLAPMLLLQYLAILVVNNNR